MAGYEKRPQPFSRILIHAGRVIGSCETDAQLQNAFRWAQNITESLFNHEAARCGIGEYSRLEQAYHATRDRIKVCYARKALIL